MDKDEFLLLATKVWSGNASPEEAALLQHTLATQPALTPLYEQYKRYWEHQNLQSSAHLEKALAATWQKIHDAAEGSSLPERPVRRLFSFRSIAVAAAIVGVLATAALIWFNEQRQPVEWVNTYNPKGIRSAIVLPDGSKVWLAADSRLKYPRHFAGQQRNLSLEGEAFFEVKRNPQKPFIVQLTNGSVQVRGTSFNIRSYAAEQQVTTSVATGLVAFIPAGARTTDTLLLTPNKKSVYQKKNGITKVIETDAQADRSWIDGTLRFEALTLEEISVILERYYGKTVAFRNAPVRNWRYTGKFVNSSPEEILQYLSKTKKFTYTISDTQIVIGQ